MTEKNDQMLLFLTPEDVWLFRDGRPFDAGISHRARSIFPPYPTVTQGAVRSNELVERGVDLHDKGAIVKAVGTATDFGDLRIKGPFLAKRDEAGKITRYFPVPSDAFPIDEDSLKVKALTPKPRDRGKSILTSGDESQLPMLLYPEDVKPGKKEFGAWLDEKSLEKYLKGEPVIAINSKNLFISEERLGIEQRGDTKGTKEGMLYTAQFVRPLEGVGLYLEVKGYIPWKSNKGMLRLGGENHAANYTYVPEIKWPEITGKLPPRFKLYFATPTYFSQGWLPTDWSQFLEGNVSLKAVAIKGYEVIGGYDYSIGGDKASQRYVSAGSVYFFEGDCELKGITNQAITEYGAEIGFGQVRITEW